MLYNDKEFILDGEKFIYSPQKIYSKNGEEMIILSENIKCNLKKSNLCFELIGDIYSIKYDLNFVLQFISKYGQGNTDCNELKKIDQNISKMIKAFNTINVKFMKKYSDFTKKDFSEIYRLIYFIENKAEENKGKNFVFQLEFDNKIIPIVIIDNTVHNYFSKDYCTVIEKENQFYNIDSIK
jgi:hypothetical protein